jgi:predicted Fe-Mo cluster-binding NifX family protein
MTIICIPTLNEKGLLSDISMHFGKAPYFTFIKYEDGEIKNVDVIESFGKHKGGSKTPAEIISNKNVNVLICGNLGPKAVSMLKENGIEVFAGANGKVKNILKEWELEKLSIAGENSCKEKAC